MSRPLPRLRIDGHTLFCLDLGELAAGGAPYELVLNVSTGPQRQHDLGGTWSCHNPAEAARIVAHVCRRVCYAPRHDAVTGFDLVRYITEGDFAVRKGS